MVETGINAIDVEELLPNKGIKSELESLKHGKNAVTGLEPIGKSEGDRNRFNARNKWRLTLLAARAL